MFDSHKLLNTFYEDHLRLGRDGRAKLAGLRDLNLERLRTGLEKLGPMRGAATAVFDTYRDQGSYAMHTLNQHPDGDYDIDTAVIFEESVLPASALDARKRVVAGFLESAPNFARDPEARTNAVTVWYAEGHHVDLAVYRRTATGDLEHAGVEWMSRNPAEITDWFSERVATLSPSGSEVTVADGQLRRIVRFVKRFCASRPSWSLPGGMITTALVAEVYVADRQRDDISLRSTLRALRQRLRQSESVTNPVNSSISLTAKEAHAAEVRRLRSKLDVVLPKLDVLDLAGCTREQACAAWNAVMRHDYFVREQQPVFTERERISVSMSVAARQNGPIRIQSYPNGGPALPKQLWVRFTLDRALGPRESVRWTVINEGDEAEAAGDLGHENEGSDTITWRSTAYRGDHQMRCELLRAGEVVGACQRTVRIR